MVDIVVTAPLVFGHKMLVNDDLIIFRINFHYSACAASSDFLRNGAWDDPERCYGEGGGRGVNVWERM